MVTLGYSHKFNALKFRILEALFKSDKPMTVRDIEYETGIHHTNVSSAMSHYRKIYTRSGKIIKLSYIQRLEKKGPNGLYRYKITKSGIEAYVSYLSRLQDGISLNRIKTADHKVEKLSPEDLEVKPEQLIPYMKINQNGREIGFEKVEDVIQYVENKLKHHHSMPESQRRKKAAAALAA